MKEMKEIIEQLVRQEIRGILAENEASIKEVVKMSLLPELRAAIRDSISDVLQDMSTVPATTKEPSPLSKEAKMPDSASTSSQKTEDRRQETETTPQTDSTIRNSNIAPPLETEIPACLSEDLPTAPAGQAGVRSQIHDEPTPRDVGHRTSDVGPAEGRYLYCVVEGSEEVSFGRIGIEDNEVYTIPYEDISAVVHNCPAEPYKSEDEEIMKGWVLAHQKVIDQAWE
ncbi:MAG: GvpL/GvpF family gas vesicle protein, partial [Spirochaetales bacterium]|nr:GvpL/GvpF family gas vesicle protein [Spirochaetales bacterium]